MLFRSYRIVRKIAIYLTNDVMRQFVQLVWGTFWQTQKLRVERTKALNNFLSNYMIKKLPIKLIISRKQVTQRIIKTIDVFLCFLIYMSYRIKDIALKFDVVLLKLLTY